MSEERRRSHGPWIAALGIASIAFLTAIALMQGVDGAMLGLAIAAIAGVAGFELHDFVRRR